MNWKAENFGHYLTIGECHAAIRMFHDRTLRRDAITATIRTPLFPRLEQSDFSTIAEAKVWCEQWMNFAIELLELRKAVEMLRERTKADFTEITALRDELHEYKYPHTKSEEMNI
jgi:hypothetical protein